MFELTSLVLGIVNSAEVIIIVVIIAGLFLGVKKSLSLPDLSARHPQNMKNPESKQKKRFNKLKAIIQRMSIEKA